MSCLLKKEKCNGSTNKYWTQINQDVSQNDSWNLTTCNTQPSILLVRANSSWFCPVKWFMKNVSSYHTHTHTENMMSKRKELSQEIWNHLVAKHTNDINFSLISRLEHLPDVPIQVFFQLLLSWKNTV